MAEPSDPAVKLPAWFYLARSFISLLVGALLVLHETFLDTEPPGPLVIVVGLALMGFAPVDLIGFFTSRGK